MPELSNREKIEEIMEVADQVLSNWERDFCEDINRKSEYILNSLTEKQQDVLDRIYKKVCNSPF